MAHDAAASLRNEGADSDRADLEYEKREGDAKTNDAISAPPRILSTGSWVRSRGGRGNYRGRP